jgi:hypothetical protein
MLYCNRCGQCMHLDDNRFVAWTSFSGTEKQYLNPDTGDVEDSEEMDNLEYGDSDYQCPYCMSSDLDLDSNTSEEDSFNQRAIYDNGTRAIKKQQEEKLLKDKIRDLEWDLSTNDVHK